MYNVSNITAKLALYGFVMAIIACLLPPVILARAAVEICLVAMIKSRSALFRVELMICKSLSTDDLRSPRFASRKRRASRTTEAGSGYMATTAKAASPRPRAASSLESQFGLPLPPSLP